MSELFYMSKLCFPSISYNSFKTSTKKRGGGGGRGMLSLGVLCLNSFPQSEKLGWSVGERWG